MIKMVTAVIAFVSFYSSAYAYIIGGQIPETDSKIMQSTVSLQFAYKGEMISFCSGTVIAQNLILTAAHCVSHILSNDIFVSSGLHAHDGERIRVTKFKYFVEDFFVKFLKENGELGAQDIAILVTEKELDLRPVQIGRPSALSEAKNILKAGYGVTSVEAEEDRSISDTGILHFLTGANLSEIQGTTVMILEESNRRTAGGDSGGPLYADADERLILHGILHGGGTDEKNDHISLYTHPYFFADWMNCALENKDKITVAHPTGSEQKGCDGIGFQDMKDLASFNRTQCESQLPGFKMNGEEVGSCDPTSLSACQKSGEILETPVSWNEELKVCVPSVDNSL